ncbi:hypothetical protein Musp01_31830 [Muricauda sp. NBRC 101325]|nr:hypothetical protein Musp01_31830 [Muricauda sp. NBRC 101325]
MAFISCNAQQVNTGKDKLEPIAVDSVAYEIVKDSIYCKLMNGGVDKLYFFKVKHPNSMVEGKINRFFVELDCDNYVVGKDIVFDPKWSYNEGIEKNKDSLRKRCTTSDEYPWYGGILDYSVKVNERNMLSVVARWQFYRSPKSDDVKYNFDLRSGNHIKINEIFKDEEEFLKFLDQYTIKKIQRFLKELEKENFAGSGIENAEEVWNEYREAAYIPTWYFHKMDGKFGIYFDGFYYQGDLASEIAANNFFISFEELKPYLTEAFKNLIGL